MDQPERIRQSFIFRFYVLDFRSFLCTGICVDLALHDSFHWSNGFLYEFCVYILSKRKNLLFIYHSNHNLVSSSSRHTKLTVLKMKLIINICFFFQTLVAFFIFQRFSIKFRANQTVDFRYENDLWSLKWEEFSFDFC